MIVLLNLKFKIMIVLEGIIGSISLINLIRFISLIRNISLIYHLPPKT